MGAQAFTTRRPAVSVELILTAASRGAIFQARSRLGSPFGDGRHHFPVVITTSSLPSSRPAAPPSPIARLILDLCFPSAAPASGCVVYIYRLARALLRRRGSRAERTAANSRHFGVGGVGPRLRGCRRALGFIYTRCSAPYADDCQPTVACFAFADSDDPRRAVGLDGAAHSRNHFCRIYQQGKTVRSRSGVARSRRRLAGCRRRRLGARCISRVCRRLFCARSRLPVSRLQTDPPGDRRLGRRYRHHFRHCHGAPRLELEDPGKINGRAIRAAFQA